MNVYILHETQIAGWVFNVFQSCNRTLNRSSNCDYVCSHYVTGYTKHGCNGRLLSVNVTHVSAVFRDLTTQWHIDSFKCRSIGKRFAHQCRRLLISSEQIHFPVVALAAYCSANKNYYCYSVFSCS